MLGHVQAISSWRMEFSAPHRSVIAVQQLPQKRNSLYEGRRRQCCLNLLVRTMWSRGVARASVARESDFVRARTCWGRFTSRWLHRPCLRALPESEGMGCEQGQRYARRAAAHTPSIPSMDCCQVPRDVRQPKQDHVTPMLRQCYAIAIKRDR
jgi:hypothetical protein